MQVSCCAPHAIRSRRTSCLTSRRRCRRAPAASAQLHYAPHHTTPSPAAASHARPVAGRACACQAAALSRWRRGVGRSRRADIAAAVQYCNTLSRFPREQRRCARILRSVCAWLVLLAAGVYIGYMLSHYIHVILFCSCHYIMCMFSVSAPRLTVCRWLLLLPT
jgi:hypothetical protein